MTKRPLLEAIQRVKKQLKLNPNEHWGPQLKYVYQKTQPKSPDLTNLSPIEELKPFKLPDFQFDEDQLRKMKPVQYPESIYPPGTFMKPTNASLIKGVNNDLFSLGYFNGLHNVKPHYNCKWFHLTYFHSYHYLSKISKSSPAVLVMVSNNNMFNQETHINLNDINPTLHNSSFPFKYATCRTKIKKLIRGKVFDIYSNNDSLFNTFGGLYKFGSKLYPESQDDIKDFYQCIEKGLDTVFSIPEQKLLNEVKQADAKVNWKLVNKVFNRFQMDPICPHYKPSSAGVHKKKKETKR